MVPPIAMGVRLQREPRVLWDKEYVMDGYMAIIDMFYCRFTGSHQIVGESVYAGA
jgi:hypothetical protein